MYKTSNGADNEPMFVNRQLNPAFIGWLENERQFYVQNRETREKVLAPYSAERIRIIKETIIRLGKLFGYELIYNIKYSNYNSFELQVVYPKEPEMKMFNNSRYDNFLLLVTSRMAYDTILSEAHPDLHFEKGLTLQLFTTIYLFVKGYSSPPNIHMRRSPQTPFVREDGINAGDIKDTYRRITKKLNKARIPERLHSHYARALEVYLRYAEMKALPKNREKHLFAALNAGMSVPAAIWMVENNVASKEAALFKEMPVEWLEAMV